MKIDLKEEILVKVKETLIRASSCYREDQKEAYREALLTETNPRAQWVMENILENADAAEKTKGPLCDDTGIPHVLLEFGEDSYISADLIDTIREGVALGLRELPGRPMAVKGNDIERLEQSAGLYEDSGELLMAPIQIRRMEEKGIRLHILMQGGGPEIRGKTYRVFHKHSLSVIIDEIISWAVEGSSKLGCTPCVPAIGIGRTHYEAASLMLEAMVKGNFSIQNDIEKEITRRLNESNIGPMGLTGNTTAIATFLKVGPQRASGVRIVCLRLGCLMEPRVASIFL